MKTTLEPKSAVRRKSSIRKVRSDGVEHVARQPTQTRSLERYEKIIQAIEELLKISNIEDISFYDVARQADISPASVNYHFPTTAALRIVLTERYMRSASEKLFEVIREMVALRNDKWQYWLLKMGQAAVDYYNQNRHISEVILGPTSHRAASFATIGENERIARIVLEGLKRVFILPEIPDLPKKIMIAIEVADALWSRAYMANGHIDDHILQEAVHIQILYLRSILPECLSLLPEARIETD
ncbi:hypothetical protein [Mesorhizobium sp. WSM4887]|uniref:TetR/AcrR family transcriptional regulator n=1 Tax=Mesorhizobium sp. WSM4887 TaxID=3038543 RepID=UPI00241783FF|nr:hypothetical protein [Mesorhizobium sp. WSM4887]MDG4886811.1 hypothetical protein [Mesorhizobium sp. WSM4887]